MYERTSIDKLLRIELKDKPKLVDLIDKDLVEGYDRAKTSFYQIEDYKLLETEKYDILVVQGEARSYHGGGGISQQTIVGMYLVDKDTQEVKKKRLMFFWKRDAFDPKKDIKELLGSKGLSTELLNDCTLEVAILDSEGQKLTKVEDLQSRQRGLIGQQYIPATVQVDLKALYD